MFRCCSICLGRCPGFRAGYTWYEFRAVLNSRCPSAELSHGKATILDHAKPHRDTNTYMWVTYQASTRMALKHVKNATRILLVGEHGSLSPSSCPIVLRSDSYSCCKPWSESKIPGGSVFNALSARDLSVGRSNKCALKARRLHVGHAVMRHSECELGRANVHGGTSPVKSANVHA